MADREQSRDTAIVAAAAQLESDRIHPVAHAERQCDLPHAARQSAGEDGTRCNPARRKPWAADHLELILSDAHRTPGRNLELARPHRVPVFPSAAHEVAPG